MIVDAALDSYGRLDILIHSAGNVRYGSLKELSQEDFDAVLDVHLRGAYHVSRPAFPRMCEAEGVKSNVIVPGALTPMADGIDTSS